MKKLFCLLASLCGFSLEAMPVRPTAIIVLEYVRTQKILDQELDNKGFYPITASGKDIRNSDHITPDCGPTPEDHITPDLGKTPPQSPTKK